MAEAAGKLQGEHDFAAFGQPPVGDSTVRVVHRVGWCSGGAAFGICLPGGPDRLLRFEIEANAFLRGMVRRIVGTLLLVGSGALTADGYSEILESREIRRAGPPAPANGLCLWRVRYGSDDEQEASAG